MRLATLDCRGRDGTLVVVSQDNKRSLLAPVSTMQGALDTWATSEPVLHGIAERLAAGEGSDLAAHRLAAPLPRAWQWLDGSAFPSHGALMEKMLGIEPVPKELPLMYQGMSHQFLGLMTRHWHRL